jgi:hypothetical protein
MIPDSVQLLITFRIFAPFSRHAEITDLMNVEESKSSLIGPPAKVRERGATKNKRLDRETWLIQLFRSADSDMEKGLSVCADWLDKRSATIKNFQQQGMRCTFFISVWFENTRPAFSLSSSLLSRISSISDEIGFDINP